MPVYKDQGINWQPQSDSLGVSSSKADSFIQLAPSLVVLHHLVNNLRHWLALLGCFRKRMLLHSFQCCWELESWDCEVVLWKDFTVGRFGGMSGRGHGMENWGQGRNLTQWQGRVMEHSGEVMDILVIRNVILGRVSIEGNVKARNARVGAGNWNGGRASYRERGRKRGMRSCPGERGRRMDAWGVYKGMRSSWVEESISEVREARVEALVMGLEQDSSTETGWILEKKSGRGKLTRVESAVMDETEEKWVEDILRHLRQFIGGKSMREKIQKDGVFYSWQGWPLNFLDPIQEPKSFLQQNIPSIGSRRSGIPWYLCGIWFFLFSILLLQQ